LANYHSPAFVIYYSHIQYYFISTTLMAIDKSEARKLINRQVDLARWETQAINSSKNNVNQAKDSYWYANDWQRDKEWNNNLSILQDNWYSLDDIRAAYNELHPDAYQQWLKNMGEALNNAVYNAVNPPKKVQFKTSNPAITNKQRSKIVRYWRSKLPKAAQGITL